MKFSIDRKTLLWMHEKLLMSLKYWQSTVILVWILIKCQMNCQSKYLLCFVFIFQYWVNLCINCFIECYRIYRRRWWGWCKTYVCKSFTTRCKAHGSCLSSVSWKHPSVFRHICVFFFLTWQFYLSYSFNHQNAFSLKLTFNTIPVVGCCALMSLFSFRYFFILFWKKSFILLRKFPWFLIIQIEYIVISSGNTVHCFKNKF